MGNIKSQPLRHCLGDVGGVALDDTLRNVEAEVSDDTLRDTLLDTLAQA